MAIKTNIQDFRPTRDKFNKTIRLLSGGFTTLQFFPDGKVTVYPWDSKMDEWVMANKFSPAHMNAFLFQAVRKLVTLGSCPVQKLIFGDVTTIVLVARALRNKGTFVHTPTCPSCGFVQDEEIIKIPEDMEMVGVKPDGYCGTDDFTLPTCGDVVTIRPLTVGDIMHIEQRNEIEKRTVGDVRATLLWGVTAIGGGAPETLEEVNRWYEALAPEDQVYFDVTRNDLEPSLNPHIKYTCTRCPAEFTVTVTLDANFFRSGVRKGPIRTVAPGVDDSNQLLQHDSGPA